MNATIYLQNRNNQNVTIVIRRSQSFKTIVVSSATLRKSVATIIVNLANMGYNVIDNTEL